MGILQVLILEFRKLRIFRNFELSPMQFTLCLLVSFADNLCKQLGPKSGLTFGWAWSGYKLFDTLMVYSWKNFTKKIWFWKDSADDKKHAKFPSRQTQVGLQEHVCLLGSDSFTILGLWVLGLAVSNINESPLQTNESKTLFLMTSLPYYCIPGLAGTHWNKNLCAKDAGCAGNKITG